MIAGAVGTKLLAIQLARVGGVLFPRLFSCAKLVVTFHFLREEKAPKYMGTTARVASEAYAM